MIDLIKYPVITEKYVQLKAPNGQKSYAFDLDVRLTKPQIKKLFEQIFQVNVTKVNTYIAPVKKKRLGFQEGYKRRYKRAIITLQPNQKLVLKSKKEI